MREDPERCRELCPETSEWPGTQPHCAKRHLIPLSWQDPQRRRRLFSMLSPGNAQMSAVMQVRTVLQIPIPGRAGLDPVAARRRSQNAMRSRMSAGKLAQDDPKSAVDFRQFRWPRSDAGII